METVCKLPWPSLVLWLICVPVGAQVSAPPDLVLISAIQGSQHRSPREGDGVTVEAIVTALARDGFYLQEEAADQDASVATSEALFVVTGAAPAVAVGDMVRVSGLVEEFRPGARRLSITRLTGSTVSVLANGQTLPPPVVLGVDRSPPTQIIDNDSTETINIEGQGSFDADEDAIDFYESLEGMRLEVSALRVSGATTVFGDGSPGDVEVYALNADGAGAGPRTDNGGVYIRAEDFNPETLVLNDALAELPRRAVSGDQLPGTVVGVLSSNFGKYLLLPTTAIVEVSPGGTVPEITALVGDGDHLTVASLNVQNLDPEDGDGDADVATGKYASLARVIVVNMASPDVIGLQEIQDNSGSLNDGTVAADRTAAALIERIIEVGGPAYRFAEVAPEDGSNGGQPGGNIRTAFLFNPARVELVSRGRAGADDAVMPLIGPGVPDLNFSPGLIAPSAFPNTRKPTLAEFRFNGQTVFVMNNHFNSKGGDSHLFDILQPPVRTSERQRLVLAATVADFVTSLLALDPEANVVVLGDLNDFEFSPALTRLAQGGLTNLVLRVPPSGRYSFVFNGNSQVLDHILVSEALAAQAELDMVHVNSDFPEQPGRASDHDPLVARLALAPSLAETQAYLADSLAAATISGVGATPAAQRRSAGEYTHLLRMAEVPLASGSPHACQLLARAMRLADGASSDLITGEGLGELVLRLASVARGAGCWGPRPLVPAEG